MKLLLDEHLSPKVVEIVRRLAPDLDIESIHDWREGQFISQADERILRAAAGEGRVLVTCDLRTIPPILVEFGVAREDHAGVIFVSVKSIPQNDLNGIAHALVELAKLKGAHDWLNRVDFLTRG